MPIILAAPDGLRQGIAVGAVLSALVALAIRSERLELTDDELVLTRFGFWRRRLARARLCKVRFAGMNLDFLSDEGTVLRTRNALWDRAELAGVLLALKLPVEVRRKRVTTTSYPD